MKYHHKAKIRVIPTGIEIAIPNARGIPIPVTGTAIQGMNIVRLPRICSSLCLLIWSAGGVMLIFSLCGLFSIGGETGLEGVKQTLTRFGSWGLLEGLLLYQVFVTESLVFSHDSLTIGTSLFGIPLRHDRYIIRNVRNLRLNSLKTSLGFLLFDYDTRTVGFGRDIERAEAQVLLSQWHDIMRFSCHAITCICFGAMPPDAGDGMVTLRNPDVSDLHFPFVHLKQVVIETSTYDFHQVERFLTYAVNVIGQEYLKTHVILELYGAPEKLHPNLRANLTTLCQSVREHNDHESSLPQH